jgi:hypothetical protein
MRIGQPTVTSSPTPGWFRVTASIQLENSASRYPEQLWYEFPEDYQDWLYLGMEPFVLAMHQFAMACGEDIEVESPISERLAYNLRGYQAVFLTWYPEFFKPIQIHHAGFHAELPTTNGRAAMTFSGGVDSFFTLFKQRPDHEVMPAYQVRDGVKIFFNMARYDREAFNRRVAQLGPALADMDFNLIPANTNTRRFLAGDTLNEKFWFLNKTFVCELTSVGMLLSGEIGRYFLPSGWHFTESGPSGSSWLTDPMLTTEWYETIHHSATYTRAERIAAIADRPIVQRNLSVCLDKPDQNTSCGTCSKCLRTMTTLDLLGKLDDFTVFERMDRPRQARMMSHYVERVYIKENLNLAKSLNDQKYVRVLRTTQLFYALRQMRARWRCQFGR